MTRQFEDFPSLPASAPPSNQQKQMSSQPASSSKSSKKKEKKSLNDFMKSTTVHPQNPWKNPALKGTWASKGAGSLAQHERALNDARRRN